MNIIEQIKQQMGIRSNEPSHSPSFRPEVAALREAIDAGQRAKRAENFPVALEAFNHATRLAISAGDTNALAITALNQADVYIAQKRWDEAEQLLKKTFETTKEARQRSQMAYMVSGLGTVLQARGDWAGAQKSYEQALEIARTSRAAGAEGRAMGHLADVYLHESNASYAIHLLREALPRLNMTGDIELSSYFVGRLGEALISAGQPFEGQQMLERALRLANQMGYRRDQRRWGMLMAQRAMSEGRTEEAYAYYQEVISLFNPDQRNGDYVQALCQMSRVCLSMHRSDEALSDAQKAGEISAASGEENLIALARATLGIVYVATNQYSAAIPELETASEAYAHLPTPSGSTEMDMLRSLAAAYAENGEPDKAVQTYQRAARRAEALDMRLEMAQAHRDLGLFYSQNHHLPEALKEWQEALTIYDAEKQNAQVARLYCDMAAARKFMGQGQRSLKDYEQASMLLSSLNDDPETRGLVMANAAIAYADQGDTDSADSFFNEAIAIARRLNNDTAEATRRGNYGWFLLAIGRPQQAISALEYALRVSQSAKLDLQSAIQTDNLGLAYDAQANYQHGLEYHQQALTLVQPLHNPHWESTFKINQANTLLAVHQIEPAQHLLDEALAQGRADEDVELIIRSLTGLARLAISREDAKAAEPLLDEAISLVRRADMRRLLAETLSVYSEQQARLNQPERSASLWEEAQKLYTMLGAPQAKIQPAWLGIKSSS